MNWSRLWAHLAAVAIVLIVACFAAPFAKAHEGHPDQARPAASAHTLAGLSNGAVGANPPIAAARIKAAMNKAIPLLRPPMAIPEFAGTELEPADAEGSDGRDCDGCCLSGSACCAHGITAENDVVLPPQSRVQRPVAGPEARLTSLAPKALPRPPRSFA